MLAWLQTTSTPPRPFPRADERLARELHDGRVSLDKQVFWGLIALFGASLVGLFAALPPALLATVAGTALLGSMAGAMGAALAGEQDRLAAAGTLAVTVSGVTLMGVGSAFWGLVFGLLILGIDRFLKR